MPIIDLHCHYVGPPWRALEPYNGFGKGSTEWNSLADKIGDADLLVAERRGAGIDCTVLSAPPSLITAVDQTLHASDLRGINEHLAELTASEPGLIGLATIDAFAGDDAAEQIEYAASLGLPGIVVDCCSPQGSYLNASHARPALETANRLGLVVLAHPMTHPALSDEYSRVGLGKWGARLARTVPSCASLLSLTESNLMRDLAGLRIVFPWFAGGALLVAAFMSGTLDTLSGRNASSNGQTLEIYMDTMGFEPSAIRYAADVMGVSRLVVGTDWPISETNSMTIRSALEDAGLTPAQQRLVCWSNAASLLRLDEH